jgi:hypothetical protein
LQAVELVLQTHLKRMLSVESVEAVTEIDHQIVLVVLQEQLDLQIWVEELVEDLDQQLLKMEDLE